MSEGEAPTPYARARSIGALLVMLLEAAVLTEALWYYFHDGESLHDALADWWDGFCDRIRTHTQAEDVLEQIRDLPETD